MFVIFFDPSPMLIVNQSFLSWFPIEEDQMDDIFLPESQLNSCMKLAPISFVFDWFEKSEHEQSISVSRRVPRGVSQSHSMGRRL